MLLEKLNDSRNQRQVGTGKKGQAHGIGILLDHGLDDLLGGLMETGVDNLESLVTEGTGNHLCTTVMTIKAGLCNNDSVGALHSHR